MADVSVAQSVDSLVVNAIAVWLIQTLKVSKKSLFSWISTNTPLVAKSLSLAVAAVTAAGIDWSFDSQGGVLTVKGLTATAIATFLWHVVRNYFFQHVMYKSSYGTEKVVVEAISNLPPKQA